MPDTWVTVARYDLRAPLAEHDWAFTARFVAETAAELPGFEAHELFEAADRDVLVCVVSWSVASSASSFCRVIREASDTLAGAYGARFAGAEAMRRLLHAEADGGLRVQGG